MTYKGPIVMSELISFKNAIVMIGKEIVTKNDELQLLIGESGLRSIVPGQFALGKPYTLRVTYITCTGIDN